MLRRPKWFHVKVIRRGLELNVAFPAKDAEEAREWASKEVGEVVEVEEVTPEEVTRRANRWGPPSDL